MAKALLPHINGAINTIEILLYNRIFLYLKVALRTFESGFSQSFVNLNNNITHKLMKAIFL